MTGCLRKCQRTIYEVKEIPQPVEKTFEYFDYDNDGNSDLISLFLYVSNSYETAEEYLLFDGNAIISAVGGALGLFLGFSCLTMFTVLGQKIFFLAKK